MIPSDIKRRELLLAIAGSLGLALVGGCATGPSLVDAGRLPRVRIDDEFGLLRAAIVHDGSTARDVTLAEQRRNIAPDMLAEHPETGASSRAKLILQHEAFGKTLADAGVRLLSPASQPGSIYQVFARDPAFAIGDNLFVGRMKDPWRQSETAGLRELRQQFDGVVSIAGTTPLIEGGDVVLMDRRRVLVGVHRNTNDAGFDALTAALRPGGVQTIRIPHTALHLDCCFAPLPDGSAMFAAAKLPESSLALLRPYYRGLIPLDRDEAALHLAANVFWIDRKRVVSGRAAKKTNAMLRARGFRVIELDFSELTALWGGFRCVVCPIERAA